MISSRNRLANHLWQLNAYIIAVAGLIAILVGLAGLYEISRTLFRDRHVGDLVTASDTAARSQHGSAQNIRFKIGRFDAVPGTSFVVAPLISHEQRHLVHYTRQASGIRNYVFYNMENGQTHHLLPDNNGLILQSYNSPPRGHRAMPPKARLYLHVARDDNEDGSLSRRDRIDLLIAPPDGSRFLRLGNIDELLGYDWSKSGELVVILRMANNNKPQNTAASYSAFHIAPDLSKILRQQEITQ